jgi:hypothetical protein
MLCSTYIDKGKSEDIEKMRKGKLYVSDYKYIRG